MKKILLLTLFLTNCFYYSFSQCSVNQVEVTVAITTDTFGAETSWTLSNIAGTIILQGGQNAAYGNNTNYSQSICVASDACLIFKIFDGFGDGIFAPGGCQVFVGGTNVYSAGSNIGYEASTTINCSNSCNMVLTALNDLQSHISGINTLNNQQLVVIRNTFALFPECLANNEAIILLAKSIVTSYDNQFGALFTTPNTINGFSKNSSVAPALELQRTMVALQQGIFDEVFTPQVYSNYPQHITGWKFNACNAFPGNVAPPINPLSSETVIIRANFENPDGKNPLYNINGEIPQKAHALRPTGLYLAPGSVATINVPQSLVGQDYYIRVGSHEWDLSEKEDYKRFDRISKKFAINATSVQVYNPFGGAISILVPYGATNGNVDVTVTNAVQAPFYSLKSFYTSPNFATELSKPGPWAVFETENVMFTIPKHSIIPGQYDIMQVLSNWETALRGMNSILARQIIPDKHNMYMIADVDIRAGAFSIGYPMSNTPLNYTDVPGPSYFLNGPGPDDQVNFHELGHALAFSKFNGEEEALVNFPYIMALNYGLGVDLNEAVQHSMEPSTFNINNTAKHRMLSNTFGSERNISNTESDEVRYQHRGYGHYFEIVNMFGWCPLRNFWRKEWIDFENGIDHGFNEQDTDGRILRLSIAAQADLRPLFHVFGILPQNPTLLQNQLNQANILPSLIVYNRLQNYLSLIPQNNAEYVNYAQSVYPNLFTNGPTDNPNFGVGWHYQKSLTYNTTEAQNRTSILQSIINLYYPNGAPVNSGIVDVCCSLDTMTVNMVNNEVVVTGGVEPYNITTNTNGSNANVIVVDFDGCETTASFTLATNSVDTANSIKIYPNPATTEIFIDISKTNEEIENVRLISINGQILLETGKVSIVNVSSIAEGLYFLQVETSSGSIINKKIIISK